MHEQNRMDRDNFIDVDYDAIREAEQEDFMPGKYVKNFRKCNLTRIGQRWGCRKINQYDGNSILHYPKAVGQLSPRDAFTAKKNCGNKPCNYGQRLGLSSLDVSDIETVYGCGMYSYHN